MSHVLAAMTYTITLLNITSSVGLLLFSLHNQAPQHRHVSTVVFVAMHLHNQVPQHHLVSTVVHQAVSYTIKLLNIVTSVLMFLRP